MPFTIDFLDDGRVLEWDATTDGTVAAEHDDYTPRFYVAARDQDLAVHPGQDIEYVVVDDEKISRERIALAHEEVESYDPSYYETQLVRAIESVLSPLGWDRTDIQQELSGAREPELTDFQ
jgi:DNA polymerase elongation subunit (family B)